MKSILQVFGVLAVFLFMGVDAPHCPKDEKEPSNSEATQSGVQRPVEGEGDLIKKIDAFKKMGLADGQNESFSIFLEFENFDILDKKHFSKLNKNGQEKHNKRLSELQGLTVFIYAKNKCDVVVKTEAIKDKFSELLESLNVNVQVIDDTLLQNIYIAYLLQVNNAETFSNLEFLEENFPKLEGLIEKISSGSAVDRDGEEFSELKLLYPVRSHDDNSMIKAVDSYLNMDYNASPEAVSNTKVELTAEFKRFKIILAAFKKIKTYFGITKFHSIVPLSPQASNTTVPAFHGTQQVDSRGIRVGENSDPSSGCGAKQVASLEDNNQLPVSNDKSSDNGEPVNEDNRQDGADNSTGEANREKEGNRSIVSTVIDMAKNIFNGGTPYNAVSEIMKALNRVAAITSSSDADLALLDKEIKRQPKFISDDLDRLTVINFVGLSNKGAFELKSKSKEDKSSVLKSLKDELTTELSKLVPDKKEQIANHLLYCLSPTIVAAQQGAITNKYDPTGNGEILPSTITFVQQDENRYTIQVIRSQKGPYQEKNCWWACNTDFTLKTTSTFNISDGKVSKVEFRRVVLNSENNEAVITCKPTNDVNAACDVTTK